MSLQDVAAASSLASSGGFPSPAALPTPTTPSAYEFSEFVSASPEAAAAVPSNASSNGSTAAAALQPIAVPPSSVSPPAEAFVVGFTPVVPEDGPSELVRRSHSRKPSAEEGQQVQRAGSDGASASALTLSNLPETPRASSEPRSELSPTRSSSDQSVGLTPAVHADSERIGSFTPATHIAPARSALAPYPSASPSPGALSDVSETPMLVPSPPPERSHHSTVPPLHSAPMSLSSGASTPAASVASNNRPVDIPLHYSSQYSPSAASRRVSASAGGLAPASAEKRNRSRSASPSIQDQSTSSAAAAISLVASPSVNATAQRGFLSNLFGWGGSSSTAGKQASVSLPSTPADDAASNQQQFPHTTTNAHSSSGSGGITKSTSSHNFSHVSAHAPLSLSSSQSLGSLMAEKNSTNSAASSASSSSSISTAAHRVSLQPVGDGMHPLLVRPIIPLTSTQHAQLLSYSVRLKAALAQREKKIAALQSLKKKYQRNRNEETSIWNKFAISSLVSIAASLYHTHLLHCSARLQIEFGCTTELSAHLNQVQLVLDGKLALKTLLEELDHLQDRHDRLEEEQILALQRASSASSSSSGGSSASGGGSHDLGPSGWTKEVAEKMKQLAMTRVQRERRRSSVGNAAGITAAGGISATAAANATPVSLKDHFLTSSEIDHMFLPREHALLQEQVMSLGETARKLDATYAQMQKKALSQSDSKQTRTFRLHTILVKHGLESSARDRGVDGEFFCLKMDSEILTAQTNFNTLILDQRTEEGRSIAKWLDAMETAHAESIVDATSGGSAFRPVSSIVLPHVSPVSILGFFGQLQGEIARRYDLAGMEREREKDGGRMRVHSEEAGEDGDQQQEFSSWTLSDCLSLYLARMLYPKLGVLLSSLRSDQEVDLDQWFHKKLAWIRELTRAQLGLNPLFLPPGVGMNEGHRSRNAGKGETNAGGKNATAPAGSIAAQQQEDDVDFPDEDEDEESETDEDDLQQDSHRHKADGHLASTQQPYTSAMSILHRLNIACETQAPIDMLYLLIRTIREVTKTANGFLEMHREKERAAYLATGGTLPPPPGVKLGPAHSESLHADNMFPLVLYVVIHAQLTAPHYVFGTLTRFLSADLRHFGTSGYALAMIESAVSHVCDMTKQQVQNGVVLTSPKMPMRGSQQLEGTPPLAMSKGALGSPAAATKSAALPPPALAVPFGLPTSTALPALPTSSSSSPQELGVPALQHHSSSGSSPPALPSSSPN